MRRQNLQQRQRHSGASLSQIWLNRFFDAFVATTAAATTWKKKRCIHAICLAIFFSLLTRSRNSSDSMPHDWIR